MDDLTVRYLSESEYDDWDKYVAHSEYGTIFHKSTWTLSMFQQDASVKVSIVGCYKQEKLIGGMIFAWRKLFGGIKIIMPPPTTCFSGLLFSERDAAYLTKTESFRYAAINSIIDFIEKDLNIVIISFPPEIKDIRALSWRGYSSRVLYTYRGDISDPSRVLDNFLPDIRRRIKKGEEYQYVIRDSKDQDHLHAVYNLLTKTFSRQEHEFNLSEQRFNAILKYPEINDQIQVFSIWNEDKPVATIITIRDGLTAYYWMAGGDHDYFNTGLNQVLFWKVINILSDSGVKVFDLMGANTSTISNYKASFNFETTPYYYVSRVNGKFLRLLYNLKSVLTGRIT